MPPKKYPLEKPGNWQVWTGLDLEPSFQNGEFLRIMA